MSVRWKSLLQIYLNDWDKSNQGRHGEYDVVVVTMKRRCDRMITWRLIEHERGERSHSSEERVV